MITQRMSGQSLFLVIAKKESFIDFYSTNVSAIPFFSERKKGKLS